MQSYTFSRNYTNSKKHFKVVDLEHATISDFATLSRSKNFHIAPTAIEVIAQRYNVMEVQNRAVGFPNGYIDRVAGIEHCASGADVD